MSFRIRIQKNVCTLFITALVLCGELAVDSVPSYAAGEATLGFGYNRTRYGPDSYSWDRRWYAAYAYQLFPLTLIELSYQVADRRTKVQNIEDISYHDEILSLSVLQYLMPRAYIFQPYVRGGIAQFNRDAEGYYSNGQSPPERKDQVMAVLGAGFKIFFTKEISGRAEATSYLQGARISTWRDDLAFTVGLTYAF